METAIMLSLFAVSGVVFMITESGRLLQKKCDEQSTSQHAETIEIRAERNSRPTDHISSDHFLDFSGGTLGI